MINFSHFSGELWELRNNSELSKVFLYLLCRWRGGNVSKQMKWKAFLVPKSRDQPQTRGEINCADASNILVARSEERKAGEERKCLHSTNDAFWSKEETVSQQMMNSKFFTRPRGSHFSYFIEQQASLSMYSAIIYKRQTLSSPLFNTDSDNIERQLERVIEASCDSVYGKLSRIIKTSFLCLLNGSNGFEVQQ